MVAKSVIIELEDDINPAFTDHDFAVISYYNQEDWSLHINSIFEQVVKTVDEAMADGQWKYRDIGFYKVDI